MEGLGLQVEDPAAAVGGGPSGLLGDHGHRVGFVGEAEFAVGVLGVGGVEKDPAGNQVPMEVRDERTDVAAVLALDPIGHVPVEPAHRLLDALVPAGKVASLTL